MSSLPDYALNLINEIAVNEGFTKYTIELKPGSKHGDNFLGVVTSVTIVGQRNRLNERIVGDSMHLVCKLAPEGEARRQEFHSVEVFQREVVMYTEILPAFLEFQREKGLSDIDCFVSYPKCYVAIADEQKDQFVVILEDMRHKGFQMWPRRLSAPVEHTYSVLEQLAKFHAISFALKDQRPQFYDRLRKFQDIISTFFHSSSMRQSMEIGYQRAIDVAQTETHRQIMTEIKDNFVELLNTCHQEGICEPFGVLGHGDCQHNNILFKHDNETNSVSDVCLIDWQLVRYCSPVLDLLYNIFGTTVKSVRDKEYTNWLKHYHQILCETIRRLGTDPTKLFTYTDMEEQMKKFGAYAFIWGAMFTQLNLADSDSIPNLDELSNEFGKDNGNIEFIKEFDDSRQKEYENRLKDLLTDLVDYGYYWK